MENEFLGHGEDIPYKGFVIGTQNWENGPIYKVYSENGDNSGDWCRIEYEGSSIEDCKHWIDSYYSKPKVKRIKICALITVDAELDIRLDRSLLSPITQLDMEDAIQKKLNIGDWAYIDV